jgi:hypothetical protein
MRVPLAQFFVATTQRQLEFVFQLPKVTQFSLYVRELRSQAALHRGAGL